MRAELQLELDLARAKVLGGAHHLRLLEWRRGAAAAAREHDDAYGVVHPARHAALPPPLLREG